MGKETFYEVLGVPEKAPTEEIKKRYKILALKCHPDKNLDNIQEATQKFNLIQEAYNVLSDPKERAWYDKHKEAFHKDEVDVVDHTIDEVYFTTECYSGFNDSEMGFYTVYCQLFDQIIEKEAPFKDVENEYDYPRFGNSKTELESVKQFYDAWQSFSTAFNFAHLNKHDIRDAPNRRIVRLMEKENKKLRDEAKKNRNTLIQELVQFVRKRDKRMDKYRKMLEAKTVENRQKSENHRRKVIEERNKAFESYVESEWTSLQGLESALKSIETTASDYYDNVSKKGKNKKKKKKGNQGEEEETIEGENDANEPLPEDDSSCTNGQKKTVAGAEPTLDGEEEEEEAGFYCPVCRKAFKTLKSYENHEKSKKHLTALERYNIQLAEDEEDEEEEEE